MNARKVKPGQRVTYMEYGTLRTGTVLRAPVKGSASGVCFIRSDLTGCVRWIHAESLSLEVTT
jgi:hypothetical protein